MEVDASWGNWESSQSRPPPVLEASRLPTPGSGVALRFSSYGGERQHSLTHTALPSQR